MKQHGIQMFGLPGNASPEIKSSEEQGTVPFCDRRAVNAVGSNRVSVRPEAILEVVRRRGRSWGLLAQYEEGRLGFKR